MEDEFLAPEATLSYTIKISKEARYAAQSMHDHTALSSRAHPTGSRQKMDGLRSMLMMPAS